MAKTFDSDDDSVVVIVGSGAGGGTLANELAQKGISSVVLEAGPVLTQADYENDEWAMFSKMTWLDKRVTGGDWHGVRNQAALPAWLVKGLGGSTNHWCGVSLRFKPYEFQMKTINGDLPGANLLDWPITADDLEPYYVKAELKMGVTGKATGMPHLPWNNNFRVVAEGARRIGFSDIVSGPMAINSVPRDGRPSCQQIGFCMQGCRVGAKWATNYTEIPRAVATGHCEVRTESMVLQIEHNAKGKVTGVIYADKDGNQRKQKARAVCVAGNTIESPRLLLNSATSQFPDGLANSSGQIGKNYMTHATVGVYAVMPEPVHMNRGTVSAGVISDESRNDSTRGFIGGYKIEMLPIGLPFMAAFFDPSSGGWGRRVSSLLEKYPYISGVFNVGEDMPQERNGVTLHDTERDQYGLPVPVVSKTPHINDINMVAHSANAMREIYEAVDSKEIYDLPTYPASHNMGTNRMSAKPQDGVVNSWGQSHDIDNLFVSDGSVFTTSGAPNPTLTIVALAIRQADYIAAAMKRRDI